MPPQSLATTSCFSIRSRKPASFAPQRLLSPETRKSFLQRLPRTKPAQSAWALSPPTQCRPARRPLYAFRKRRWRSPSFFKTGKASRRAVSGSPPIAARQLSPDRCLANCDPRQGGATPCASTPNIIRKDRTMTKLSFFAAATLVLAGFAVAGAQEYKKGDVTVSQVWVRPAAEGKVSAAYFSIENHGSEADKLTGAESSAAGMTMLHETIDDNGVMKMRHSAGIEISGRRDGGAETGRQPRHADGPEAGARRGADHPAHAHICKSGHDQRQRDSAEGSRRQRGSPPPLIAGAKRRTTEGLSPHAKSKSPPHPVPLPQARFGELAI